MGKLDYRAIVDEVMQWETLDLIDVVVTGRRDYVQQAGSETMNHLARANYCAYALAVAVLRQRGFDKLVVEALAAGDALNRANVHHEQHKMGLDTFQTRMQNVNELLEAGPEEKLP
jgi:hypothetical protein